MNTAPRLIETPIERTLKRTLQRLLQRIIQRILNRDAASCVCLLIVTMLHCGAMQCNHGLFIIGISTALPSDDPGYST
jgi:hypothetical protein